MTAPLVAGLLLGLAGSGHCALMCGPLAAIGPERAASTAYHAGRLAMYLSLGLIAGFIGSAISNAGMGRLLALVAGSLLVAAAIRGGVAGDRLGASMVGAPVIRALGRAGHWVRDRRPGARFAFGALNGLLPCGLVYAAVLGAIGLGTLPDASLFIVGFWVGTVPLLTAAGLSATWIAKVAPAQARLAAPVALALVGALLIVRGVAVPHPHVTPDRNLAPVHAHR